MEASKATSNFPYKTLIWVTFALVALFLFKPELKQLLGNAEELTVFGVKIKGGKEKAKELEDAVRKFNAKITNLSDEIAKQQTRIKSLNKLKLQLEKDLASCPDAKKTSVLFNAEVSQIYTNTNILKSKSDKLKEVKILEYAEFGEVVNAKSVKKN